MNVLKIIVFGVNFLAVRGCGLYTQAMIAQLRREQRDPHLRSWIVASAIFAGITLASGSSLSSSSQASTRAGRPAAAGNASAIKACDLLTLDEIKQATGARMGAGLLQTTDTQASCDWNAPDGDSGASAVGVIVQKFDAVLWQTMSSSKRATAVTGIGEQAYKGYPHKGDLSVKQGGYEVDVGIIDFKHDNGTVDAAALKLMKLVLSRL